MRFNVHLSLLIAPLLVAFFGFAAPSARASRDLRIELEPTFLALAYNRFPGEVTEVQGSSNLVDWNTLELISTVAANPDGSEHVRARVDRGGGPWSFFRVVRSTERAVTFRWDPANDPTVVGYALRIWKKSESTVRRIDAGVATSVTIVVADGSLYGLYAVSYTAEGIESAPSNAAAVEF